MDLYEEKQAFFYIESFDMDSEQLLESLDFF
jgi:hypothetical protein